MKKFTTAEIRDLLNQVYREEISFSRMVEMINERVDEKNEPQYKDGDFVVSESGNILIFRKKDKGMIYDHALFINVSGLHIVQSVPSYSPIKRYATEEEKQILLDALAKRGKRWNAEKLCIEDIPVGKFKKGDKVRIKDGISSKTHRNICPWFVDNMDDLIGKTMTVDRYTEGDEYVACEETEYIFLEEWLELYVEDIPKRKFKAGDKVKIKDGISSKTHSGVGPSFVNTMDKFIGKELTVKEYSSRGWVVFYGVEYEFSEDWLEPYEELKEGDLAIFWDDNKKYARINIYDEYKRGYHFDIVGFARKNAIKFESKEQFERLIKGEI